MFILPNKTQIENKRKAKEFKGKLPEEHTLMNADHVFYETK